jgi:hypothetical protein
MSYIGDYAEDYATLNIKFTTAANGVPTTLVGTPAISIYKANDVTQSTAGITLTADFDSVTGANNVLVDLSSDAFYATGQDYQVIITTGTVAGISVVGYVVAEFSIANRSFTAATTEPSSPPAATASIVAKIGWLFALSKNKGTQTSTTKTLRNDGDGADIGTSSISDDGITFTRGKWS